MKCPYCNKYLKQVHTTAYCYWCGCDKTDGMFGTLAMWEKVASLAKIRKAGRKYTAKPEIKEKRTKYIAQRYATDPEFKQRRDEYVRKYRSKNKDKVKEWAKKYRETHREYYNEYMRNYRKNHFANASKKVEQKDK